MGDDYLKSKIMQALEWFEVSVSMSLTSSFLSEMHGLIIVP